MKKIFNLTISFFAITTFTQAHADIWDGVRLKSFIEADERFSINSPIAGDEYQSGILFGYVVGVHDALNGVLFCTPRDISIGEMADVVKNYLKNNPRELNKNASEIVRIAFTKTYPCKKS